MSKSAPRCKKICTAVYPIGQPQSKFFSTAVQINLHCGANLARLRCACNLLQVSVLRLCVFGALFLCFSEILFIIWFSARFIVTLATRKLLTLGRTKLKNFVFHFVFRSFNRNFGFAEVTHARENKIEKLRLSFCFPLV